jgi:hypothetical protein
MELAELRKRLRALGFRIKTQSMSHGIHATIMDDAGHKMTGNVFTPETLEFWKPAMDACSGAKEGVVHQGQKVYGLAFR